MSTEPETWYYGLAGEVVCRIHGPDRVRGHCVPCELEYQRHADIDREPEGDDAE